MLSNNFIANTLLPCSSNCHDIVLLYSMVFYVFTPSPAWNIILLQSPEPSRPTGVGVSWMVETNAQTKFMTDFSLT